jgi:hypothetical protein
VLLAMAACGGPPPTATAERTGTTTQAIYGGVIDDDAQANDAVVALTVGTSAQDFVLCTATLIAPDAVLTAHHCVGSNLAPTVTCDQTGASTSGSQIGADVSPSTIHVFVGAQPDLTYGTPDANGVAIFDTESSTLCNSDIAVVLLDKPITTIAPLAVRLSGATQVGESVRAVGFGQNDQNAPIGTRFRKDGLSVLAIGAGVSASGTSLGSDELELGMSTCEGDSGGPAISAASGAVVGVVSRGGACTDDFGHIDTMTSGFADLIRTALSAAGEVPLEEVVDIDASTPGGAPGATGAGSSPPAAGSKGSPSADAGDPSISSYEGTANAYPQSTACARVAPAPPGDASFLAGFCALGAIAVTRRRSATRR